MLPVLLYPGGFFLAVLAVAMVVSAIRLEEWLTLVALFFGSVAVIWPLVASARSARWAEWPRAVRFALVVAIAIALTGAFEFLDLAFGQTDRLITSKAPLDAYSPMASIAESKSQRPAMLLCGSEEGELLTPLSALVTAINEDLTVVLNGSDLVRVAGLSPLSPEQNRQLADRARQELLGREVAVSVSSLSTPPQLPVLVEIWVNGRPWPEGSRGKLRSPETSNSPEGHQP
ncbi:MAG: hypothetical protein AB1331_01590 [Bacillota bacterium]